MRDDAFPKLAEVGEISTADDQVRAVGPQFVEDIPRIAGQAIACLPCGVPGVGGFVVAFDAVLGSEERLPVVFNNASDGEPKVGPGIHEVLATVVKFQF